MKSIVASGHVPGIIGYDAGRPVAWCSVAPRETFASLNRSRVLKRIDDTPVWSIVCLYAHKEVRGGVMEPLIRGAVAYAKTNGGIIVEAYPSVPKAVNVPPVSSFMGFPAVFEKIGFVECARPSAAKRILRYHTETDTGE